MNNVWFFAFIIIEENDRNFSWIDSRSFHVVVNKPWETMRQTKRFQVCNFRITKSDPKSKYFFSLFHRFKIASCCPYVKVIWVFISKVQHFWKKMMGFHWGVTLWSIWNIYCFRVQKKIPSKKELKLLIFRWFDKYWRFNKRLEFGWILLWNKKSLTDFLQHYWGIRIASTCILENYVNRKLQTFWRFYKKGNLEKSWTMLK